MDIYTLDDSRKREHIVDRFESFIWTERFAEYGDFELLIQSTDRHRDIFAEGTWVVQNGSYRVMVVETIEDTEDSEGRAMLKPVGRSLEAVLEDRIAASTMEALQEAERWVITDTPGNIIRHIFSQICYIGTLDVHDAIPNLLMTPFPFLPEGTISEPQGVITVELEADTLYNIFKSLCTTYSLGFCLLLNPVTGMLHFRVITGTNRTSAQSDEVPVIFSPDLDNLSNTSELISSAGYKNVAIVTSDYGMVIVYADGAAHSQVGFARRILHVKVSLKEADANKTALMTKAGQDELAKHRRLMAFDGEISQRGHQYGYAYFLGDITEMRKRTGATNYMRVTEQIFADDIEGERSFPTLTLDAYIGPGSWYAYPPNDAWYDVDEDTVWYDLPG